VPADGTHELGKLHTQGEPSGQAGQLKLDFARLKRRRMRWADVTPEVAPADLSTSPPSASSSLDTLVLGIDDVNRQLRLTEAVGPERARLLRRRIELVRAFCALKYAGCDVGPGQPMSVKLMLPNHPTSGGPLGMVGVVIGPRGHTQKRMQAETGTSIVVRGKGTRKPGDTARDESDDDPPHILIRGPTTHALGKARALLETLLDFNSPEGERMRSASTAELRVLNGTARETGGCRGAMDGTRGGARHGSCRGATDMMRLLMPQGGASVAAGAAGRGGLGDAVAERGLAEPVGDVPPWGRSGAAEAEPMADGIGSGGENAIAGKGRDDAEYTQLMTEVGGIGAQGDAPAASASKAASPREVSLPTPPPPPQQQPPHQQPLAWPHPQEATASASSVHGGGLCTGNVSGGGACPAEVQGVGSDVSVGCGAAAYGTCPPGYAAHPCPHAHCYPSLHAAGIPPHGFTHAHAMHARSGAGASQSGACTGCAGAAASWAAPVEGLAQSGVAHTRLHMGTILGLDGAQELWMPGLDVGLGMGGVASAAGMSGEAEPSLIARLRCASAALGAYAIV
jgi:splicing factor 1